MINLSIQSSPLFLSGFLSFLEYLGSTLGSVTREGILDLDLRNGGTAQYTMTSVFKGGFSPPKQNFIIVHSNGSQG